VSGGQAVKQIEASSRRAGVIVVIAHASGNIERGVAPIAGRSVQNIQGGKISSPSHVTLLYRCLELVPSGQHIRVRGDGGTDRLAKRNRCSLSHSRRTQQYG